MTNFEDLINYKPELDNNYVNAETVQKAINILNYQSIMTVSPTFYATFRDFKYMWANMIKTLGEKYYENIRNVIIVVADILIGETCNVLNEVKCKNYDFRRCMEIQRGENPKNIWITTQPNSQLCGVPICKEGDIFFDEFGNKYICQNGQWVLYKEEDKMIISEDLIKVGLIIGGIAIIGTVAYLILKR